MKRFCLAIAFAVLSITAFPDYVRFWNQSYSGAGPSFVRLYWESEKAVSMGSGIVYYSPVSGYYIYRDGVLAATPELYSSPHSWDDSDVKLGETHHYVVRAGGSAGTIVIEADVVCQSAYQYCAERETYYISSDGGKVSVPFKAGIHYHSIAETSSLLVSYARSIPKKKSCKV